MDEFARVGLESSADLGHHRHVAVAELPGDEFERGAAPSHPHGPVVPGVAQGDSGESKRRDGGILRACRACRATSGWICRGRCGRSVPTSSSSRTTRRQMNDG